MGDIDNGVVGAPTSGSVRISSRSGRVHVIAEDRDLVLAEKAGETVDLDADGITVSSRSSPLVVRVPEGTDVVVGTISGRVTLDGRLGSVAVNTVSARISIDTAERVDVRTMSGRVTITACLGEVRVDTVGGRTQIGSAGAALLSTRAGRISVDAVAGKLRARTVSGRVDVTVTELPLDVKVESVSGRIRVTAPSGATPRQRLTTKRGDVSSDLPHGTDGELSARSVSGSIHVDRAS